MKWEYGYVVGIGGPLKYVFTGAGDEVEDRDLFKLLNRPGREGWEVIEVEVSVIAWPS